MESPSIMDNTTVVGGALSNIGETEYLREPFNSNKMSRSEPDGKPSIGAKVVSKNLRHTPDYLDTDRPFFIKIGKDGLISALQKLDKQLQQVRGMEHYAREFAADLPRHRATRDIFCLARFVMYSTFSTLVSPHMQSPTDWIGKEITPGELGLINHGGLPKLLTRPGRYPGFPLRNWWARTWCGTKGCKLDGSGLQ